MVTLDMVTLDMVTLDMVTLDMVTLKMKTGTDGARFICYLRARLKRCALPCC